MSPSPAQPADSEARFHLFQTYIPAFPYRRRLCGTIQVASFHPHYRFAGTEPNAPENYTNRSPYPMLHLLRETSISQAADASDEVLEIPRRNIETMRNLGQQHILKRLETLDAEQ